MTKPIRKPKQSVTYQEDSDVLAWIEEIRRDLSARRGRNVGRGEVLRWLTRRARRELAGATDLGTTVAVEV